MGAFIIHGGKPLMGSALISSSKNAILPILSACLLTAEECLIRQIPGLDDVSDMCELISNLGANVKVNGRSRKIQYLISCCSYRDMVVSKLRASSGNGPCPSWDSKVALPGGCPMVAGP